MTKTGLFFGTQTGNTEMIAEMLQKVLDGDRVVTLHNVADDEDNQSDLTDGRINTWVTQLKQEFGV